MGFRSAIANLFRPRNDDPLRVIRELYGGQPAASGVHVTPDSAMRCAAVYACVRVLSESVAQLPRHVYKRNPDGGKTRYADHPLEEVLNRQPNEWQTSFEFFEMMMAFLCLRGDAFAYINRVRGQVVELIPMHPDCMEVKQRADYTLEYSYRRQGMEPLPVPATDVFHVRGLSSNGYRGLAPITAYREAVGLAVATQTHGSKLFANGAKPSGTVSHPKPLSDQAAKNLRESIEAANAGMENAHRILLLEEGMKWDPMTMTAEDSQFLETRKFQRSEIASIFRVQPHKIGDLERATFSNIEQQSIEFVTDTLLPWLRRFEQAIARDLLQNKEKRTVFVEFLVDSMLRGDTQSRYTAHNLGINGGWKTRNECRLAENLNPIDGLDEILTPLNMTKGAVPAPDPTPKPPADPVPAPSPAPVPAAS